MPVGDGPFGIMPPSRGNGGEAERAARVGRGLERPVRETQERTERRRPRGGLVRRKKKEESHHWPFRFPVDRPAGLLGSVGACSPPGWLDSRQASTSLREYRGYRPTHVTLGPVPSRRRFRTVWTWSWSSSETCCSLSRTSSSPGMYSSLPRLDTH